MTIGSHQLAFRMGGDAYFAGLSTFENPFEPWDSRAEFWERGYYHSKHEQEVKR